LLPDLSLILLRLNWNSALDILLVFLIFYWILTLIQGTKAVQLLRGILILVVVAYTITSVFDLTAFRWLISNSLPALLVAIPVIFQPELRRALERLGRTGSFLTRTQPDQPLEHTLKTVSTAAQKLSDVGLGALIVLERETGLEDYIETGVRLDSLVSVELLISVFYTNTPLHDGAVVIRNDRVIAASALLPLSRLGTGSYYLGTRHRAALGISEVTDAIVIVVSEETRMISVAYDGRMIRELDETRLLKVLKAFYRTRLITTPSNWSRFRPWLSSLHKQAQKQ
jgi:uncharacterized protein (TIGR00159 family)